MKQKIQMSFKCKKIRNKIILREISCLMKILKMKIALFQKIIQLMYASFYETLMKIEFINICVNLFGCYYINKK